MTLGGLLWQSLRFHRRDNLAILLGVAVGTAVLTGALLVGDSLRGSLHDLTLERLGWVEYAMVGARFVRTDLADKISADRVAPILLLQASITREQDPKSATPLTAANKVVVLGVDDRFWQPYSSQNVSAFVRSQTRDGGEDRILLNSTLANELHARVGDKIALHVQKSSDIPRESLMGRRDTDEVVKALTFRVAGLLNSGEPGENFSLNPSPESPRNAFVPLAPLQQMLGLEGRVNAILVAGPRESLDDSLHKHIELADWNLAVLGPDDRARKDFQRLHPARDDHKLPYSRWRGRVPEDLASLAGSERILTEAEFVTYYRDHHPYLNLESGQMLLEPSLVDAAQETARELVLRSAPTLIYLADTITDGQHEIPYSVVAALDPSQASPLGPFLPPGAQRLADDEMILVDWPESPLQVKPGDQVSLVYYQLDNHSRLDKRTAKFRLLGRIPLAGPADDADLTPEFKGITDQLDIKNWEQPPFPYDNRRVKPADERYWNRYRTAPKAYITLAAGQRLWQSRFGNLTSLRLAPGPGLSLADAKSRFAAGLLARLDPAKGGLVFNPVRERGLAGSSSGTDFGGLFLGFSFFLIGAALLLVCLLFRLNMDRRGQETGLLLALGYRRAIVRRLLIAEGALVALVGGMLGSFGALLYAWLMLDLLRAWWPGQMDQSFLRLHVTTFSLVTGYSLALVVSIATIFWAVRVLGKVPARALLAGETTGASVSSSRARAGQLTRWLAVLMLIGAVACLLSGRQVHDSELKAMSFFCSGALALASGLVGFWRILRRENVGRRVSHELDLPRLAARNASRNPTRSLLTAGLLAAAVFLVVSVQAFYREPGRDFLDRRSGSGGLALMGESDIPIFQDLNSTSVRRELHFPGPDEIREFFPFRLRGGDDASCLNLYKPGTPRLLGTSRSLIERGGFKFKDTLAQSPEEKDNPWLLLTRKESKDVIPVFGEANSVEWMLHKGLGDELEVNDDRGGTAHLRIVGLLQDSVFQAELLMSEEHFLQLFPRREGYQVFLIDASPERIEQAGTAIETSLRHFGFMATPTARRLATYLAVENTYLSTFQALGGLGLVLGALGLAVVLMRTALERRGELALLRAIGFSHRGLRRLLLLETGFLLLVGLGLGTFAALLAVFPHFAGEARGPLLVRLLLLLGAVLLIGPACGALAVRSALRTRLIPALRRE